MQPAAEIAEQRTCKVDVVPSKDISFLWFGQASSSTAVLQEWLLRGGNARALTYAVWCEVTFSFFNQPLGGFTKASN